MLLQIFSRYLKKLLFFLRISGVVGGLEISDEVLRFAFFDGKAWKLAGERLPAGVMKAGKIQDRDGFISALKNLKSKIFGEKGPRRRVNVVASISSIGVYSQVFSLPIIEGENLDKAIQLNIQMVSPMESSQAYSGWQFVGRDQDSLRLEILSAFIDRSTVDEITRAMYDAGFFMVALESRALALARVFREASEGFDANGSCVLVSLDNSGIDFLVIRHGHLYFEYFTPWRDIADEGGQISMPALEAATTRNLQQVLNFYGQHWSEPVQEVAIAATALGDDIKKVITENFSLPARDVALRFGAAMGPEWFISLGCGLRGQKPRGKDEEISLLGVGAQEEFRREQLIELVSFWRVLMPATLGLLLVLFLLADLFLIQTRRSPDLETRLNLNQKQLEENKALAAEALDFNRSVAMIKFIEESSAQQSKFIKKIAAMAAENKLSINTLNFSSPSQPITMTGSAKTNDDIIAFKKALEGDPAFSDIKLPLTGIESSGGAFSFSITFTQRQ